MSRPRQAEARTQENQPVRVSPMRAAQRARSTTRNLESNQRDLAVGNGIARRGATRVSERETFERRGVRTPAAVLQTRREHRDGTLFCRAHGLAEDEDEPGRIRGLALPCQFISYEKQVGGSCSFRLVPFISFFLVLFPWPRSSYTVGPLHPKVGPDQPAAAPAYSQARCMRPLRYGPSDYAISHSAPCAYE